MLVSHWVRPSVTDSCLEDLIGVTLACEDANSKFVEVVTIANVDHEDRVGYSLLHWLIHSCLVNLIDVTLTCEDANSKFVEVVTVADVDAEDHVGKRFGSWR